MWGAGAVWEMGFPALGWRFRCLSGVLGPLAFDDVPGSGLDSCLPAVFGGVVFGCAGLGLVFGVGVAWDGRSPPPGFVVVSSASPGSGKGSPGRVPGHRTGGPRICFSVAWRPVSGSRFQGGSKVGLEGDSGRNIKRKKDKKRRRRKVDDKCLFLMLFFFDLRLKPTTFCGLNLPLWPFFRPFRRDLRLKPTTFRLSCGLNLPPFRPVAA